MYLLQDHGFDIGQYARREWNIWDFPFEIELWKSKWLEDSQLRIPQPLESPNQVWLQINDDSDRIFPSGPRVFTLVDGYSRHILAWQVGQRADWAKLNQLGTQRAKQMGDPNPEPRVWETKIKLKELLQFELLSDFLVLDGFDPRIFGMTSPTLRAGAWRPPNALATDNATVASMYIMELCIDHYYNNWVYPSRTRPYSPTVLQKGIHRR